MTESKRIFYCKFQLTNQHSNVL